MWRAIAVTFLLASGLVASAGGAAAQGEGHCRRWIAPPTPGGPPVCRERAERPSSAKQLCRLKRSFFDASTLALMCIYQRPGFNAGEHSVSMGTGSSECVRTVRC
jgi:hypothetical protein